MSVQDGGPAFPKPAFYAHGSVEDGLYNGPDDGMSLRDYFAAHAPKRIASWFEPDWLPRPEPVWDHEHPSEYCCDCSPTNYQAIADWKNERARQFERQWPYAYADAMLEQRARGR